MVTESHAASTEGSPLRILGVRKSFPAPNNPTAQTLALDAITLSVAAGELVSIIGPNSAGKSTLLKAVLGLVKAAKSSPEGGIFFGQISIDRHHWN